MRVEVHRPEGTESYLLDGNDVLSDGLKRGGLPLNTRCAGQDRCGGCLVELVSGAVARFDGTPIEPGETFRSCQARGLGETLELRVPARSLLAYRPQIVGSYRVNVGWAADPLVAGVGLAVDIGTTTVVVQAVDTATGEVLGQASRFNQQMRLGDDVLTRINLCLTDPAKTEELAALVRAETLAPLAEEAMEGRGEIAGYVVAGNTTMLHLFTGTNPGSLGVAPFAPSFLGARCERAGNLGLPGDDAPVHLLAGAAAYVGADITAGVFVSGLAYDDGPSLLVDVGTNGEIVLKAGGELLGCATAAGPAFEGSGLTSGMRAGDGALAHVRWNGTGLDTEVIGGKVAAGICGSAYVDLLAELRRAGWLGPAGRFTGGPLRDDAYGKALAVANPGSLREVRLAESDVALLMQAKAAVAAGIETLLRTAGVRAAEVRTLYLAGGFGMHLSVPNAIACGLLPGFSPEQVQVVGNTSLAGATVALLDRSAGEEIARIAEEIRTIELNLDPDFEDSYIDNLVLA